MAKWECKNCGHIGYPTWLHNDDKCSECLSGQIVEITENEHKQSSNIQDSMQNFQSLKNG